jgi:hypothetical protein
MRHPRKLMPSNKPGEPRKMGRLEGGSSEKLHNFKDNLT